METSVCQPTPSGAGFSVVMTAPIPDCGTPLAEILRECMPLAPAFCVLCPRNPANAEG
jgi:hypothetical protein